MGQRKKMTLSRRWRRWKRRMSKRHPALLAFLRVLAALIALLVVVGAIWLAMSSRADRVTEDPALTVTPAPTAEATPEITPTPVPTPTSVPTPAPTATPVPTPTPALIDGLPEELYHQTAQAGFDYSNNDLNKLIKGQKIVVNDRVVEEYQREDPIEMCAGSEYTQVDGVVTFRGNNYRDGNGYGFIPENPSNLSVVWNKRIGGLDDWEGVGWTGQPAAVKWSKELREQMNIKSSKKANENLVEVIYATLDGHIYFLDMLDGEETRDAINIGAPIKGSVSVDPRGLPLLYCGQGIYDVHGKRVDCGTRIWSLIDQSKLYFIDGKDDFANRPWRAFDSSPLVDASSDTLLQCGENGVLYSVKLNSSFENGVMSINPEMTRYVYSQKSDGKIGTEGSLTVYDHYAYFANNSGIIQCVDLNTMRLVWSFNGYDDTDASMALEVQEDGVVALYVGNEVDTRGHNGTAQMFKFNALTGELLWVVDSDNIYQNNENGGGTFASPGIGKGELSGLVYYQVCRTKDTGSMLYALNKDTGERVWEASLKKHSWSSPVCLYTESGKGYVLVGDGNGILRLFDGLTGEKLASVDLGANIEATPVVIYNMLVVGTRGGRIYGVKIS